MLQAHPADVVIRPLSGEIPWEVAAVRLPSRYMTPATAELLDVLGEAAKPFGDGRRPR